jgi:phage-related protein
MKNLKKLEWIFSAKKDLIGFPESVKNEVGYALYRVQEGKMPPSAKHMKGLSASVMEIVADYNKDTFRAVYVVNLGEKIYVLHCFQKKSKKGIQTPKEEVDLIKQRLKWLKATLKEENRL